MIPMARPQIGKDEQRAVAQVMASGNLAAGDVVANFEKEFAEHVGTAHAVAVANGSLALQAALEGLGIGPGDEVIVPAFTFVASANAVLYAGAKPVLVDVDPATFTLDPRRLQRAVGDRTRAVLAVHLFGQACDMGAIEGFAERHDLAVVGDAAQAHGARMGRRKVGGFGAAEAWSFHTSRNMTSGEGGMVTTDDEELARKVRSIANHGHAESRQGPYDHLRRGMNWRMSNVHAAIGRVQLRRLDGFTERRRMLAERYARAFGDLEKIQPPEVGLGNYHVYHRYTLRCDDRPVVMDTLQRHDVASGVYYPKALHQYPHLEAFGHSRLGESMKLAHEVLSVPVHPSLSDEEATGVIEAVQAADAASEPIG